ncbi:MAG: glutathione S-transferase N-terminal domain-containing protein [Nitrosomonas sp.]|nr:glutathione S-transferase N-terminal domain-containing protein [Nitrosomonas sp.]
MMTLYSIATCPFSHRCRIVLHEKDMDFQVLDVDPNNIPEDLAIISPYGRMPLLVERDLVLYDANIINEYIDERFPHPQLMPADPVMRARTRLLLHRFEKELFCNIDALENNDRKTIDRVRAEVANGLTMIAAIFDKQKYMLGDEYSMLDVAIAPLLWRLDHYGIKLPKQAAALLKYSERLFSRPLFIDALTPSEKLMRK